MQMTPKISISLPKIQENAAKIRNMLEEKGMTLIAVSKVVMGDPLIARALTAGGIQHIGDSRIQNIIRMKQGGVTAKFVLIRVPTPSEIHLVVKFAEYSCNSEIKTIELLSAEAEKQGKTHKIILMVDMGDLREGVAIDQIDLYIRSILSLKGVSLAGIGTNLKCFGGVIPEDRNMGEFSRIADKIMADHQVQLEFVSGGNSANFRWLDKITHPTRINNLRIGEGLFIGTETIQFERIADLHMDIFDVQAEIAEIKSRIPTPRGTVLSNAFGEPIKSSDTGIFLPGNRQTLRKQALLNLGRQDVAMGGLKPKENISILGASSDYLIVDLHTVDKQVGDFLHFSPDYTALMRLMASPYVEKEYLP